MLTCLCSTVVFVAFCTAAGSLVVGERVCDAREI